MCLAQLTNTATAATYYLDDTNGKDANAGTSWQESWKTINRALPNYAGAGSKVASGDTIMIKNGSYGCFSLSTYTGTDWITYQAADGHTPVFQEYSYVGRTVEPAVDQYIKFDGIKFHASQQLGNGAKMLTVNRAKHVKFINCEFVGAGYDYKDNTKGLYIGYSENVELTSCKSYGTGPDPCDSFMFAFYGCDSDYVTFDDCNITGSQIGIVAWGTDWTIKNCEIHHLDSDGIQGYGCANLLIEDNHIHDILQPPNHPEFHNDAIQFWTASTDANSSDYTYFENIIIRRNNMHNTSGQIILWNGFKKPTGYLYGSEGITIEDNLIYGSGDTWSIHLSDTNNLKLINNTIIGDANGYALIFRSNTRISVMANNIINKVDFYDADINDMDYENYNIINKWWVHIPVGYVQGEHTVELGSDQLFANLFFDSANDDYRLASGSVAIDFANPIYAPATDILRNSRVGAPDAGCYEYVVSDPNNHAPVLETIGNKSVSENSLLIFIVTATDADGNPITYLAQSLPSGATFAGQTFSWTPSYTQAGTYSVTFRASDGRGGTDSETITITVINVNRAPVLAAIGNKSVNEGSTLSFSINATDADNDTITYSAPDMPTGAAFAGRTFTWTPGYTQAGTYPVTFIASDGQAQDSQMITITVNNVNQAPVLSPVGNKSAFANDLLAFSVSATEPDGDTITYSATGLPSGATFTGQNFSWTPTSSQAGTYPVTFIASDGQLQDSEAITITVYSADTSAPTVNGLSPAADSIQVPLNNLVILHITDSGKGVDANSVTIKVNNNTVYTGNTADYSSQYGHCRRAGTEADYAFIYQSNTTFDYDQTVNVAVNAKDLAGNTMNQYSYSFATEMRSFGKNKIVNSASDSLNKGNPATVRDSAGNIWAAWHAGQTNSREVYVGRLAAGADDFDASVQVTNNSADQYNAAIAIDASDKLYLVWQDNRRGNWDIYISTSVDGINWSAERRVTDSNNNATNPAIAVDHSSPPKAYIAWQDEGASNQEIYIASSSDSFATGTISRITSDSSNQIDPAIAVNASNTVYVVWADSRNGSSDIYGAASNNGPWTNMPVIVKPASQTSPAIATEAAGAILHLLWVDDTAGNKDIYYAASNGLPTTPLTGRNIVDDSSGADQLSPAIITTGSTGAGLKVFACWQDKRNAGSGGDTDLYFVDVNSDSGTNIFTGDDATNSNQSAPVIGIDGYGYPYLMWADDRNQNTDIYYAGSTFVRPNTLASQNVSPSSGATVGTDPASINSVDDVSIVMPAGAYPCELNITISKVENPPKLSVPLFSFPYEFGPSGVNFDKAVTITIPYNVSSDSQVSAYWYNTLAGALSQQGITDVETIVISPTLHALSFKTTHFTQFLVGGSSGGSSEGGGGGGGGGGCALSSPG
ncbi:MAG: putative Ig domain-containing protein, partial [Sedimentisphaerales bacterium]|nr:putative Ig domain-containing protein [Sedimentisphaerales bacterium]